MCDLATLPILEGVWTEMGSGRHSHEHGRLGPAGAGASPGAAAESFSWLRPDAHHTAAYFTSALTDAVPLSVNVQVLVLLPPLEQAPDQIASRPFETLSEIELPVAKDAEPLLPTLTLMPAGLDVTRSPLRPVALTVKVALVPGGFTVSVAVLVTPPKAAEMVAAVAAVTALVVTVKLAPVAPAGTVTLAGTAAAVELEDSVTAAPPVGAALVSVTLPCEVPPPVTVPGFNPSVFRLAGGGGADAGVTVSVAARLVPLYDPVSVTLVFAATALVVTPKLALLAPAATVTLAGTPATAGLLLARATTAPPEGAAALKLAVPVAEVGPTTLVGFTDTADKLATAAAACGSKRCVLENGPKTPAEFCARTRHHKRCAGRPPMLAWETLTT